MSGDDHSVNISGSANVSGQVASGDKVTQTQHVTRADPQLADALDRLAQLLDQYAGDLPEPDKARRDLADVRAEIAEPSPDKDRISDSLQRLTRRVASVGALADAVRQIAEKFI